MANVESIAGDTTWTSKEIEGKKRERAKRAKGGAGNKYGRHFG